MEEKKGNGLLVVIALLCLLIGGVGGYFVTTNFLNKNEVNNESNTSNEDKTSTEKSSQSTDEKTSTATNNNSVIVDKPVYNVTTKTIPKTLVGKYVNTEEAHTYVEIKTDGTVVFSASACEDVAKYSTDKDIEFLAFYQNDDTFTFQRNSFELIMKPGLNHNFGGDGILSLFFKINGDITGNNISLEALDNYGCSASKIYKK